MTEDGRISVTSRPDVEAIRHLWDRALNPFRQFLPMNALDDLFALCDEVDRLRNAIIDIDIIASCEDAGKTLRAVSFACDKALGRGPEVSTDAE